MSATTEDWSDFALLSDLAKRWLVHARDVFACSAHHRACDAPSVPNIDPSLRWPGFVGPVYEKVNTPKKKLLLVGRIHNPSGWSARTGLGDLEVLIRDWLTGNCTDEEFYRDYNREYARRLATWGPWTKVYRTLANAAGVDETGIAYANVAKCWQYPGKESKLQRACSATFPLEELVDIVKPQGVFLLATDAWVSRISGAQVRSVPFMNDSAPHFQLPPDRIAAAVKWVGAL
ncbi:MAG: hypothetical protein ABI282_04725 [Candidatus Baltobacteraceae bacterium]